MDPINILVGVILIVSMAANFSAAKTGIKRTVTKYEYKPKTWLQKTPPNFSALVLVLQILAIFNFGTLEITNITEHLWIRMGGIFLFAIFSWLQVKSTKELGPNYSQDIAIIKNHQLVTTGLYKFIRHPQYLSQILSDLGAGIALLGYVIIPAVLFIEIPLLLLRAAREDSILGNYFKEHFSDYKKRSGFIIPFLG